MLRNLRSLPAGLWGVSMLVVTLGFARTVDATTFVSGRIQTNTTWTLAGSPYVVQSWIWVYPNITLTVEPGVVVKLSHPSGPYGEIYVEGSLVAIGTQGNHITFTSLQDDSIGGDTGGDGSTTGSPGQWYSVWATSLGTMTLKWVDVSYGGWGSSDTSYGAINAHNGAYALLDHVRSRSNQRAGLLVSAGATADVAHSEFSLNAVGVSVVQSTGLIHSNSSLSGNTDTGLFITLQSTFSGTASSVQNSEISNNANWGVWLTIYAGTPSLPYGQYNNIRNNGFPNVDQRQISSVYPLVQSQWANNYWGDIQSAPDCPWAPTTTAQKHLSFEPESLAGYCAEPGKGPAVNTIWTLPGCPDNKPLKCAADFVTNTPYATEEFDNSEF